MLTLETRNAAENRIAAKQFDGPYSTKINEISHRTKQGIIYQKLDRKKLSTNIRHQKISK